MEAPRDVFAARADRSGETDPHRARVPEVEDLPDSAEVRAAQARQRLAGEQRA